VFALTVPILSPGPVELSLRAETERGYCTHEVTLNVPVPAKPELPDPVRAMIETARIDERGVLHVVGWAVSLSAFEKMQIFLGEHLVGEAQRGLRRDDVAVMLPEYANAGTSGFLLHREVTDEQLRAQTLRLIIVADGGVRRAFTAQVERPARVQRPAREKLAKVAIEECRLTDDGIFAIKGWGVATSGVTNITVAIDDTEFAATTPGEERADVGNSYPRAVGAGMSGFRLQRRLEGRFEGEHIVRVTVRGHDGEHNSDTQTITAWRSAGDDEVATTPARSEAEAMRFYLDTPACKDGVAIETVRGFLSLRGWAFGRDGIERIDVFVDEVPQGRAHHGIRREDLNKSFPGENALLSGFAMMLPPQVMKKGEHIVRLEVRDKAGRFKETSFKVLADHAADGPGPWALRSKLPQAEIDLQHAILTARACRPAWTVLLAPGLAEATTLAALIDTVETLRWQAYESWRAIILAGSPEDAMTFRAAMDTAHADLRGRIAVQVLDPAAGLETLAPPDGWLTVLGAGDRLGEDALLELTLEAALSPAADFIYSDERRVDPSDGMDKAFFKPDFSPDLLLSMNYIGRAWAASTALLRTVSLTQGDLVRAGEYDMILRLTERAGQVLHVAKVLCGRARRTESRMVERAALQQAMRRRKIRGSLAPGPIASTWRVQREIAGPVAGQMVSIIIPTVASRGFIRTAIESIRAHTAWPAYEIVVLDNIPANGSAGQLEWKAWIAGAADVVVEITDAFNWSRFNNVGALAAGGSYLLFLNDDIEVTDKNWLHGLMEQAQRPEIGVVGPQLLYPDGRVQHAGMFLARQAGRHAFRFYPADEPGPFGLALTQRDVISVTGACMMIRREVFDRLGGFDEAHAVVNNDLDFSLRARAAGFAVIYTPSVSLIHHEMVSRADLADTHDSGAFLAAWGDLFLKGDPFFSRWFSPDFDDYLPDSEPVKVFTTGHPLMARERIRRILAVKVDHIGDFIIAFPAFQRLKEIFPDAELSVLAAKASVSLAALEPAIDRVIEFNFYHARSEKGRRTTSKKELAELRARLLPERFDLAIDLRRQGDTRPILQSTGARWLAGFDRGYEHRWLDIAIEFEGDVALAWKRSHAGDSLIGLVDALAAQCRADRTVIRGHVARAEDQAALRHLVPAMAASDGPVVAVHTGAGALNKQWPSASFAGLIDLLIGELAARVVVIGGADEAAFAQGVVRSVRRREAVASLVGKTSLRDLPSVLRAADLYIGNDSGPKHIAAALGVPTIGVHSGSVDAGEWGALGPAGLTIRRDMMCSPCYLALAADCHRGLACLDGIRVAEVFAACRRMLGLAVGRAARVERAAE
jgi:ADP-heptose:LPS heptosyltransferase/GT2 family glycosyltransferase